MIKFGKDQPEKCKLLDSFNEISLDSQTENGKFYYELYYLYCRFLKIWLRKGNIYRYLVGFILWR